jgi:hypothetical protein
MGSGKLSVGIFTIRKREYEKEKTNKKNHK